MSLSDLSDKELIARLRKEKKGPGNYALLFEELWLRYGPVIDKVLRKRLGKFPYYWSDEDVEDFKQAVAEAIFSSFDQYKGKAPFAAWVGEIAANKVTDEIRRRTGLKHLFSLGLSPTMEAVLDRGEVPSELRKEFNDRAVSKLRDPEVQRQERGCWVIFADKAAKYARGTRKRYKAWKNYDKLDVYHWGDPKELRDPQRKLVQDESGIEAYGRHSAKKELEVPDIDTCTPADEAECISIHHALSKAFAELAKQGPKELKCAKAMIQINRKGRTKEQVAKFLGVSGRTLNTLLHENFLFLQERLMK